MLTHKSRIAPAGTRIFSVAVILSFLCGAAAAQERGSFVRTGDMTTARSGHTATLLPDGKVLIAGGGSATAELYDPSSGTFAATGAMRESRRAQSATLLPDGRVLIAGGLTAGGSETASAELYDPVTGTFSDTGAMLDRQEGQSATLLRNGKVLIAGGLIWSVSRPLSAPPELYDPATGTFSSAGAYASFGGMFDSGGPLWPTAGALPDGRVLLVGENPPEIYDPQSGLFAPTARMSDDDYRYGVYWQTTTSLPDGSVLVTGGNDDNTCGGFDVAELYNPSSGTFRTVGSMTTSRDLHTATLLRDGTVLIAGGGDGWCGGTTLRSAEVYLPATESFSATGSMNASRNGHSATLLLDGSVLIAGGTSYWPQTVLKSAELYRPTSSRGRSIRR